MSAVSLADAQARLPELIAKVEAGDEVVITRDGTPVARLVSEAGSAPEGPKLGTMKGSVLYMAPDFDAPLEDFREYME